MSYGQWDVFYNPKEDEYKVIEEHISCYGNTVLCEINSFGSCFTRKRTYLSKHYFKVCSFK